MNEPIRVTSTPYMNLRATWDYFYMMARRNRRRLFLGRDPLYVAGQDAALGAILYGIASDACEFALEDLLV